MSNTQNAKEKPTSSNEVSFSDATGEIQADSSLNDMVGKTILIKSFESKERPYKGEAANVTYITCTDGKILFTWSETVRSQLDKMAGSLDGTRYVKAKVTKARSSAGEYIALGQA